MENVYGVLEGGGNKVPIIQTVAILVFFSPLPSVHWLCICNFYCGAFAFCIYDKRESLCFDIFIAVFPFDCTSYLSLLLRRSLFRQHFPHNRFHVLHSAAKVWEYFVCSRCDGDNGGCMCGEFIGVLLVYIPIRWGLLTACRMLRGLGK